MRRLLLALSALPALATAQESRHSAQAQTGSDVVVTARPRVETKQAREFARSASAPVDDQLARFMRPACPMAIGFPRPLAAQIVARMRDVIDAARAPLAPAGCRGNMIVMAAPDGGQTTLRAMKRLDTPMIHGVPSNELAHLIASPGPVWSWTITEVRNEDGQDPDAPINQTPTLNVSQDWLLQPGGQQTIGLAVVLIDWSALYGKTARQIGDYAAMRTLAKTRPVGGSGAVQTILGLFDPDAAPVGAMTGADLAYLKSLYRDVRPYYARTQIEDMARGVRTASSAPSAPRQPTPQP